MSNVRARSFCCPTERCSPSRSSLNQACTAFRTSPILTPRKEAVPLRYLVHHSRVSSVAYTLSRNCSLSLRPSSAGEEGSGRFIDRHLLQLDRAVPTGCHPPKLGGRERGDRFWALVGTNRRVSHFYSLSVNS